MNEGKGYSANGSMAANAVKRIFRLNSGSKGQQKRGDPQHIGGGSSDQKVAITCQTHNRPNSPKNCMNVFDIKAF